MLSLVLGSEITDASVAAIASSYPNLELLDLSGYVSVPILIAIKIFIGVLKLQYPWRPRKEYMKLNAVCKYNGKFNTIIYISSMHFS